MQLLIFNEEFLVNVSHQLALITSLPFVHTARRSYRLNDPVRFSDWSNAAGSPAAMPREVTQTLSFRGRRSRNKVSVGEPAEGSLPMHPLATVSTHAVFRGARLALRVLAGCRSPPPPRGGGGGRQARGISLSTPSRTRVRRVSGAESGLGNRVRPPLGACAGMTGARERLARARPALSARHANTHTHNF